MSKNPEPTPASRAHQPARGREIKSYAPGHLIPSHWTSRATDPARKSGKRFPAQTVQGGVEEHVVGTGHSIDKTHQQAVKAPVVPSQSHETCLPLWPGESPPHCSRIRQLLLYLVVACIRVPSPQEHFSSSFPAFIPGNSSFFSLPFAATQLIAYSKVFTSTLLFLLSTQGMQLSPPFKLWSDALEMQPFLSFLPLPVGRGT